MFVLAWVDKHIHYDQVNTSRVESSHCALKRRLLTSTRNLFGAVEQIVALMRETHSSAEVAINTNKITTMESPAGLFDLVGLFNIKRCSR